MIIKQYLYNDHLLWWAIDRLTKNVNLDYIIRNPTPYACVTQLGTHYDGINSLSLYDDFDRPVKDKRLLTTMFQTSADNDHAYSALSGEPIYDLGSDIRIKFQMMPEHKNLVPGDYWYGEEKHPAYFDPMSMATYFLRCDIEKKFLDPKPYEDNSKPENRALTSVFCPKTEEEIMTANAWSYLVFDGLWDCEDLDEEFRKQAGIDMLVQTRSEACYI